VGLMNMRSEVSIDRGRGGGDRGGGDGGEAM
jgi:hypothetical protein